MSPHGTLIVEDLHMTYQTAAIQCGVQGELHGPPGVFHFAGRFRVWEDHDSLRWSRSPRAGVLWWGHRGHSSAERIAEPPPRRDIGMVFQSYAIWPHLSVFDNVAFPLVSGRRRFRRQEVHEKTMRALRLVQLDNLAERPAPFLSGGQQQRVALARALVAEPTVLLLDEPLSNLDAKLRAEMRFELKNLVKSLGVTTLYVTHDQMEALTMSDKRRSCRGSVRRRGHPQRAVSAPALGLYGHLPG